MANGMVICDGCRVPEDKEHCCQGEEKIVVNDAPRDGPCDCWPCLEARVKLHGEVVRRLTAPADERFSVALAFISLSEPHRHLAGVETYTLLSGKLAVYLGYGDEEYNLLTKPGATAHIPEGRRHWARSADGKIAIVSVVSIPAWDPADHVYT